MLIACDREDLEFIAPWVSLIHSECDTQHWVRVDARYNFHEVRAHLESIEPLAVPSIFIQETP